MDKLRRRGRKAGSAAHHQNLHLLAEGVDLLANDRFERGQSALLEQGVMVVDIVASGQPDQGFSSQFGEGDGALAGEPMLRVDGEKISLEMDDRLLEHPRVEPTLIHERKVELAASE
jgi:hypothetical protein